MEEKITVAELDQLVEGMLKQTLEVETVKRDLAEKQEELKDTKVKIGNILQNLGRDKYDSPFGKVYTQECTSVKTPNAWEEKQAYMDYLMERGGEDLVHSQITFNNNTLKSFIKAELDLREQEGNLDRSFPGVGEPNVYKDVRFRKA